MTYIRDLDPQWEDPRWLTPFDCSCGFHATWEDVEPVTEVGTNKPGHLCPICNNVTWEDEA